MWKAFRTFLMRGNVVDLATGVILGAAFSKITTSLVGDVLMPPLGMLLGRVDFSNLYLNLSRTPYPSLAAAKAAGAPTINYGLFLNTVVEFVIVAFAIFLLLQALERLNKKKEEEAKTRDCPYCTRSIPQAARRCPECTSELRTV
jgi:large conductance mechanosensitive channel